MNNKELINNAPEESTHIAFSNFDSSYKYLQADPELINNWYHWVDGSKCTVDYDFSVVYDDIRSIADIKKVVELEHENLDLRNALQVANRTNKKLDKLTTSK